MTDLSLPTGTVTSAMASWSVDDIVSVCPSADRVISDRALEVHASRRAVKAADVMVARFGLKKMILRAMSLDERCAMWMWGQSKYLLDRYHAFTYIHLSCRSDHAQSGGR